MRRLKAAKELDHIHITGAREHNLKNIDVSIPKKKFVVVTGVSGSGKSSLAIDTIFAEGRRRYAESLSAYARQFLGQLEKPKFETIRGLAPAISIDQKTSGVNPRSTVGTVTEIYDYLRVFYARVGTQFCHICGKEVGRGDAGGMVRRIMEFPEGVKILILAPIVAGRKGEHRERLEELAKEGFARVRIDGVVRELDDVQGMDKRKKHNIEVVVDRLKIQKNDAFKLRLTDSVETALRLGNGELILNIPEREDIVMSEARSCCGHAFPALEPNLFSFNSPRGMCSECHGLGTTLAMDEKKVVTAPELSIREGAVAPWKNYFLHREKEDDSWGMEQFKAMESQWGVDFDTPWEKMSEKHRKIVLYGAGNKEMTVNWKRNGGEGSWKLTWEGLIPAMLRRYRNTKSEQMKAYYNSFMSSQACSVCHGSRLRPEVLCVKIEDQSIGDLTAMPVGDALSFLESLTFDGGKQVIAGELLNELKTRLGFLINVGLNYLTLDRKAPTLSGGESQRIRLASQIGSELSGVLYILDEPSIGLHQKDNIRLIRTFEHLRDIGNTLIVIEHDRETMEMADWILDIGPGAGRLGGQVVAAGTPKNVAKNKHSLTGDYLAGRKEIRPPARRRKIKKERLCVKGANENNLKNVDVNIPLGVFSCVTGVSGAGKSSLIRRILFPALRRKLHDSSEPVGKHKCIEGLENIDKVINIDQQPIGRTPRSNPATYTKLFDLIRDLYAQLPESKASGYKKGRFSFNVKGGRCEHCQGDGYVRVEMHFLADVFVPCEVCHGRRFNDATLHVKYKTWSIADVLDMSVREARDLFENQPKIAKILDTLIDVGLEYVKLGQSATTLSGGEAQRVKLARELAKSATGRTLYILDEPTTGLHFEDINKLLVVLHRLVDAGNTVLVIEHNLDVIKCADWLIDLGPEGGSEGGEIVAVGTPEEISRNARSHTGKFLKELL